jgi:hypothetical protein
MHGGAWRCCRLSAIASISNSLTGVFIGPLAIAVAVSRNILPHCVIAQLLTEASELVQFLRVLDVENVANDR